jgi:hypothetical protein
VVLDLEATNQMDVTSADALSHLIDALHQRGIELYLVRVMWPVRRALRACGLMERIGEDHLWHSISQGVRQARHAHGLRDLPAAPGVHGVEAPEEDLADDAEEHIAARTPPPVDPSPPREKHT